MSSGNSGCYQALLENNDLPKGLRRERFANDLIMSPKQRCLSDRSICPSDLQPSFSPNPF